MKRTWVPKRAWPVVTGLLLVGQLLLLRDGYDGGIAAGATTTAIVFISALGQSAELDGVVLRKRLFGVHLRDVDMTATVVSVRRADYRMYWPTVLSVGSGSHSLDFQKWFWRGWPDLVESVSALPPSPKPLPEHGQ